MSLTERYTNMVDGVNITKVVIKSSLVRFSNYLKICHFNAQSMHTKRTNKMDEIRDLFVDGDFEIIGISETWLKPYKPSKMVEISGYKFYRNDRVTKRGGGVGLYVKSDLKCKVVAKSIERSLHSDSTHNGLTDSGVVEYLSVGIQFLFLEILVQSTGRKILCGVVYNPNSSKFDNRQYLQPVFDNLFTLYSDIILMGDFNTNILKECTPSLDFCSLMNEFNLSLVSDAPTHFVHSQRYAEPSCIDLLICNQCEDILSFSQIDVPGFSRHDLIFAVYNICLENNPPGPIFYRDYRNMNVNGAMEFIHDRLQNFYYLHDSNTLTVEFNSVIKESFDRFVPLRKASSKRSVHNWFTDDIRELISRRNNAYRIWSRTKTNASLESYKFLRRLVKRCITEAKNNFMTEYIPLHLGSKQLWDRIRSLGIIYNEQHSIPFSPNEINQSFIPNSTANTLNNNLPSPTSVVRNSTSPFFSFRNVTPLEVFNSVTRIKSNAVGYDEIPIKFIKMLLPFLLPYLLYIFNSVLTTSVYPSTWKIAKVIPIPKVALPKSPKDLRPISILPGLSKALEYLIKLQINEYLTDNGLLTEAQSGFRKSHSTETALLSVCDDITTLVDEKNIVLLTLLDFSKAFDTIDHNILNRKLLNKFGFSTSASNLIDSYLTGRAQFVSSEQGQSDLIGTRTGVPQGSILGPLIFTLYINDLPSVLQHCGCRMFADDVQIYVGGKSFSLSGISNRMNEDLLRISLWAQNNMLLLNPTKSQSVLFSVSNFDLYRSNLPPILLNGTPIPISPSAKNLGVILDSQFTWNEEVNSICGKIYAGLRRLWASESFTTLKLRKQLVNSLLLPHITYCLAVKGCLSSGVYSKLQKAFFGCLRFIYKVPRYRSVSHYAKDFLGCTLKDYLKLRICIVLHKIIINKEPLVLYNKLSFGTSIRLNHLRVPKNRTSIKNKSFFVYGVSIYNSIPTDIKLLSLPKFKLKTKHFLSSLPN